MLLKLLIKLSASMAKPQMASLAILTGTYAGFFAKLNGMAQDVLLLAAVWITPIVLITILDARFGIRASAHRGERFTSSRLLRDTGLKLMSYFCWLFAITAIGYNVGNEKVGVYGMLFALFIEGLSILENWLETKDISVSWAGVWNALKSALKSKTNIDLGDGDILTKKGRGCGELPKEEEKEEK